MKRKTNTKKKSKMLKIDETDIELRKGGSYTGRRSLFYRAKNVVKLISDCLSLADADFGETELMRQ